MVQTEVLVVLASFVGWWKHGLKVHQASIRMHLAALLLSP